MNRIHRWLCRSSLWRRALNRKLIPWALDGIDLGDCLLEVGPGPGLTTDVLSHRVAKVTAIEIDSVLAEALTGRTAESNVTVVHGDATDMPFEAASFSSVVAFTMLHHVPSPAKQDRLFSEAYRVLRPSGVFAGIDNVRSAPFWMIHYGDTCVPIDPDTLGTRLQSAGFVNVAVEPGQGRFRFRAERSAAQVTAAQPIRIETTRSGRFNPLFKKPGLLGTEPANRGLLREGLNRKRISGLRFRPWRTLMRCFAG